MSDRYVVYRGQGNVHPQAHVGVRRLVRWDPRRWAPMPPGLVADHIGFLKNWVYYWSRLTVDGPYRVYRLVEGGRTLSQCIVTDASPRFPFMAGGDWQIGLVHTPVSLRGHGFGTELVRGVLADLGPQTPCWWLTEIDNRASRRLIESVGFALAGMAERRSRGGLGYFELIRSSQDEASG